MIEIKRLLSFVGDRLIIHTNKNSRCLLLYSLEKENIDEYIGIFFLGDMVIKSIKL